MAAAALVDLEWVELLPEARCCSGACNPSPSRGASCLALRVEDEYWLFDVGEGAQVQLQRCFVKPARISKIFIGSGRAEPASI